MGEKEEVELRQIVADAMVKAVDVHVPRLLSVIRADERAVRANVASFSSFAISWPAAHKLEERAMYSLNAIVIRTGVILSQFADDVQAQQFVNSRRKGYVLAVSCMKQEPFALADYFRVCCSVPRVEVEFDDLVIDPEFLRTCARVTGRQPSEEHINQATRRAQVPSAICFMPNPIAAIQVQEILNTIMTQMSELADAKFLAGWATDGGSRRS